MKKEQIVSIHSLLIKRSGGLDGIRDNNLLESALQAPFQTFAGEELYPAIQKKAACLGFGLVNNHGFIDGKQLINKFRQTLPLVKQIETKRIKSDEA